MAIPISSPRRSSTRDSIHLASAHTSPLLGSCHENLCPSHPAAWPIEQGLSMTDRSFCITQKHLLGPHTKATHRVLLNIISSRSPGPGANSWQLKATNGKNLPTPWVSFTFWDGLQPCLAHQAHWRQMDTFSSCPSLLCQALLFLLSLLLLDLASSVVQPEVLLPCLGRGEVTPQGNPGPAGASLPNPQFVSASWRP